MLAAEADACRQLNVYAVSGRYPDISDIGEDEGRQTLAALERIRAAMVPLLPADD